MNESTSYIFLEDTTRITFQDVINEIKDYDDDMNLGVLGYNKYKDNNKQNNPLFVVCSPSELKKFDKNKEYVAALVIVDEDKWLNRDKGKSETIKGLYPEISDLVDDMEKSKDKVDFHSFVHLYFDKDGVLDGAEVFATNDGEWLTDELGLTNEHDVPDDFYDDEEED